MKYFTILISLLISNTLFAQNPHSQSKILEIDYYDYKATDFEISNPKNLIKINEKEYTLSFDSNNLILHEENNYSINKGNITYRNYKGKYFTSESDFLYSKNNKILEKRIYKDKKEEVAFKFDKKNRLTQITTSFKKEENRADIYIDYNDTNNTVEKYKKYSNDKKLDIATFKTNKNGYIISKHKKSSTYSPNDRNRFYNYNGKNVQNASKNETLLDVIQTGSVSANNYKYNSKNLLIEDSGDLNSSDFKLDHYTIFEYTYDAYGNWIVKYEFSTRYGFQNLKDENYKGISKVYMRKLTYKNGDITGETAIESSKIQSYLNTVVSNNPFKTKKAPKKGVFWVKSSKNAIKFYINGEYIGSQFNLLTILNNDFYANDSINNTFYKLKDFKLKPLNKEYYKAEILASNNETVWFKSKESSIKSYRNGQPLFAYLNYVKIYGNQFYINDSTTNSFYQLKDFKNKNIEAAFYKAIKIGGLDDVLWIKLKNGNYTIIKNGKNITKKTKMVYAKNKTDVILKIDGTPKYVMINAKNASPNNFEITETYQKYIIDNPNENKKEVIPNGFLWKKNEKEQFYIYKDGKVDPSKVAIIGFYKHQFVYNVDHNSSYLLEDFDSKEINKYHNIKALKGNLFFYKTNQNTIGLIKNGKTVKFKNSKYTKNQIDVRAEDENGQDIYILKNYKNLNIYILGEVIDAKYYKE